MANVTKSAFIITLAIVLIPCAATQQKGQWVPGQSGLNAGVLPDSGFTYEALTISYSSDSLKDSDGHSVPMQGTYSFWALENIFLFVPKVRVLGGHLGVMATVTAANGSLTGAQSGFSTGGYGLCDVWAQPFTLGWHFSRADSYVACAFVAPTGRYNPGATDNVGSGFWGNHIETGTTLYLTKNKGTTANMTTDWEVHGQLKGSDFTPGQAFTTEWGLGQMLPVDKQMKKLLQLGLIGYDQWQVSANTGEIDGLIGSLIPYYSVHAVGFQSNFIVPVRGLSLFLKYEREYRALAQLSGRTVAFGGSWTLRRQRAQTEP